MKKNQLEVEDNDLKEGEALLDSNAALNQVMEENPMWKLDYNVIFVLLQLINAIRKILKASSQQERIQLLKESMKELAVLMVLLKLTGYIEKILSGKFVTPILNYFFGDIEEEKRKVEQEELELRRLMAARRRND